MRRYYEILGISEDADEAAIKQGYRRKAAEFHPDRNKAEDAADRFKEVKEAYECLSDPERKLAYDERGDTGAVDLGNPAEDLFLHILNEIMDHHDTVFESLERARGVLQQMIDECMDRKFQTDQDLVKLNRLLTAVKHKGTGADLVTGVIQAKLQSNAQLREELDIATTAAKGAYDLLKEYVAGDKPRFWTDVTPSPEEQKFLREMGLLGNIMAGPKRRRRGGFPGTGV